MPFTEAQMRIVKMIVQVIDIATAHLSNIHDLYNLQRL